LSGSQRTTRHCLGSALTWINAAIAIYCWDYNRVDPRRIYLMMNRPPTQPGGLFISVLLTAALAFVRLLAAASHTFEQR
jgi:hypothetical protein